MNNIMFLRRNRVKSLTGEFVDNRAVEGDRPPVKCSNILSNRMQCPRPAVIGKHSDPENREALCSHCFSLQGYPQGYQKEIRR